MTMINASIPLIICSMHNAFFVDFVVCVMCFVQVNST